MQFKLRNLVVRSVVSVATDLFGMFWRYPFSIEKKTHKIKVYLNPNTTGAMCTATFSLKTFLVSSSINISRLIVDFLKTEVLPGG